MDVAVLGSGRGSNFQAILKAIQGGVLTNVRICVTVSNNSGAGILEIARANSIPAFHISRKQCASDDQLNDRLLSTLSQFGTELVVLAGYMKRLDRRIIERYSNRILNIHPALLPRYGGEGLYGMHVHEAVIQAGEKESGATVHLVDEDYDHGPIVLQQTVPVASGETVKSLAAKVIEIEHQLLPDAIQLFAEGRITVNEKTHQVAIQPL
ncbi:MAG TPA: phosphoribosylglycinamide formyltransferase [Bacteroidota bacterium]|jgi:phosphoribosylglycinamide formyltransferase-1